MTYATPPSSTPAYRETNGLGIAGFVCSLVGIAFTGGILCPIGVILSLVAMGREPRGFAVAGLIVGLFGMCGWVLVFVIAGGAMLAALGLAAIAVVLTETEKVEITSDMANIAIAVKTYEGENDYPPADLGELRLRSTTLTDPWGNPYAYHLLETAPGFDIISSGADGAFGTADDVALTALGDAWQVPETGMQVGPATVTIGERTITAEAGDGDDTVIIDLGDRAIEITPPEAEAEAP